MKTKPQDLTNEVLIENCKFFAETYQYDYLTELITRFERLSLGKDAEKAIEKLEELQQPTLQVGWEYQNGLNDWVHIISIDNHPSHPYNSMNHGCFTIHGAWGITNETNRDLILSTGRPVKKVQENDEVEALAREIYSTHCQSMSPKQSFELAEGFIQTRNERRGKK
jgi:hypothetical protein